MFPHFLLTFESVNCHTARKEERYSRRSRPSILTQPVQLLRLAAILSVNIPALMNEVRDQGINNRRCGIAVDGHID